MYVFSKQWCLVVPRRQTVSFRRGTRGVRRVGARRTYPELRCPMGVEQQLQQQHDRSNVRQWKYPEYDRVVELSQHIQPVRLSRLHSGVALWLEPDRRYALSEANIVDQFGELHVQLFLGRNEYGG